MARSQRERTAPRSASSRTPLAVFHRESLLAVGEGFTSSGSARAYRKHLQNLEYADVVRELEQLERDLQSRRRESVRDQPSALWRRLFVVSEFSPRQRYAAQFVNSTRRRLAMRDEEARLLVSADEKDREQAKKVRAERREAERALRVLMRLLFDSGWLSRGRKRRPTIGLPERVKAERERLLAELQAHLPEGRRAAARRIIAREVPSRAGTRAEKRLLQRKSLRPVDVTNQILAWKYQTRPAAIQAVAAAAPKPPDILYG